MTGENSSAEFACGQILFTLKHSKLNYIVKETPYSAYITIRKKLLKPFVREASEDETSESIVVSVNDKNIQNENSKLKDRNLDLERMHALLLIEFEELEIKHKELKNINGLLDDKAEELVKENSKLENDNAALGIEFEKEKDKSKVKLDNFKKEESERANEKLDLIEILEMTLENRNKEVKDLKVQLSKAVTENDALKIELKDTKVSQFKCNDCDYGASTEAILQEHIHTKHEPTCKFCELKFKTSDAFEKHTCKINIKNADRVQAILLEELDFNAWVYRNI